MSQNPPSPSTAGPLPLEGPIAQRVAQLPEPSMSEIAFRIGDGRVQNFSRDCRRRFGVTPTADRCSGPRL